jgi:hypothetical protein
VIRDFKTSDPYVVLKLGNQVIKVYVSFSSWVSFSWPIKHWHRTGHKTYRHW